MFGILKPFYMGGNSLPGAQSEVCCVCVCAVHAARVHVRGLELAPARGSGGEGGQDRVSSTARGRGQ